MTYQYQATVVRVVDGDTIIANVDLGFGVWLNNQSFRLLGINAREKSMTGGPEATANLAGILPVGQKVVITSFKPDKYGGRYDAKLQLGTLDLSTLLIETGWAAAWNGDGSKPVPPWPRPRGA